MQTTSSLEKIQDSHIADVLEASEASESETIDPDKQDTCRGTLPSDSAYLVTRLENPEHFACSDPWKGPSYGQKESEKEFPRVELLMF